MDFCRSGKVMMDYGKKDKAMGDHGKKDKAMMDENDPKANLLKAVPNQEAYNKLSQTEKDSFNKAAKKAGLPMKTEVKKA